MMMAQNEAIQRRPPRAHIVETLTREYEPVPCVYPNCDQLVPVKSFGLHLARCRRKWHGPSAVCKYDCRHVVPVAEERFHEITCPDRWQCENKTEGDPPKMLQKQPAPYEVLKKFDFNKTRVTVFGQRGRIAAHKTRGHFGSPRMQNRRGQMMNVRPGKTEPEWCQKNERSPTLVRQSLVPMRGKGRGHFKVEQQASFESAVSVHDFPMSSGNGFSPWAPSKSSFSSTVDVYSSSTMAGFFGRTTTNERL